MHECRDAIAAFTPVKGSARHLRGVVMVVLSLGALAIQGCNVVVGQANPNGCTLFVDNPHESTSIPGEISVDLRVDCQAPPAGHRTELILFRSPVGEGQWDAIAEDDWSDGAVATVRHNLHDQHVSCPEEEFDYQAIGSHDYRNGPNFDFRSPDVVSNVVTVDC